MRVVSTKPYGSDPRDGVRVAGRATGVASIGAGMVHVSAAADHSDIPLMMVGFELVAVLQVALGCLLLWRLPGRTVLAAGIALMLASIGLWAVSRTVGLGGIVAGTHTEPVGFRDAVTVTFELAAGVGLLALLLRARGPAGSPLLAAPPLGLVGALAVALGVPALLTGGHSHGGHPAGPAALHAGLTGGEHGLAAGAEHRGGRTAAHAAGRGDHRGDGAHGRDHPPSHGDGDGSGHAGHAQRVSDHSGHGGTTLAAAHTHPATTAPGHSHPAAPGTDHTAAGGTHGGATSHPPAPGGTPHPGHEPAPPPPAPPAQPEPQPTLTDVVEEEVDKLIPGR